MMAYLGQTAERLWMGIYLRFLALVMAYGALVHGANLLGFGEMPWHEMPLSWRVGDVVYALVDTITAIGLWLRRGWGLVGFLGAIASQFFIYTVFINAFAFTLEQRQTIYGLLGTEAILVLVLVVLWLTKK